MRHLFILSLFLFLLSCSDPQQEAIFISPSDLVSEVSVSDSGSGNVSVSASATNARSYMFDFGDGSDLVTSQTGTVTHTYRESGTYVITISAFANAAEPITEEREIMVSVTRDLSSAPTTGFLSPTSYPGMTLVWQDEFDGTSLNLNDWIHEIGTGTNGWGNNELQYYRSENTSVADGSLIIEARQEDFQGSRYTSSRIITRGNQEFRFGRIDIRAALPLGQGVWPALWMLGANFPTIGWPRSGEIDIMELLGQRPDEVFGTVHWDESGARASFGNIDDPFRLSTDTFADEWHVFSIEWDQNTIIWYVDDEEHHRVALSAEMEEFQLPFFFIFNVAVGGNLPGSPDATTSFPQRMYVDYVRVFQ